MFLNIDGNHSNFDTLLVELKGIGHSFPVIGLAETNVDEPLKNLFIIPKYDSFYQNTLEGKSKGTGVALYVRDDLNASLIDKVGFCTPDIESLFIQVSNTTEPMTIGVVYRPPSGEINKFLDTLNWILTNLPKNNIKILGDYNIDLLKDSATSTQAFETLFLQNGFAPIISIPTHERHNCKSSCIDNILTNNIESVIISGTLNDNRIGDHIPIFEISKTELPKDKKPQKCYQLYDFSNSNLNKFVTELEWKIENLIPSTRFSEFTALYCQTLDNTCKLSKPKLTKRTPINNPWITDQLVAAIDKKHTLRNDWTGSITKTNSLVIPYFMKNSVLIADSSNT